LRKSADIGNKITAYYTFLQVYYLILRTKRYILLINSNNLQKRCEYEFTLKFRIVSLYYKPFLLYIFVNILQSKAMLLFQTGETPVLRG